jgi:hypothetical protein
MDNREWKQQGLPFSTSPFSIIQMPFEIWNMESGIKA